MKPLSRSVNRAIALCVGLVTAAVAPVLAIGAANADETQGRPVSPYVALGDSYVSGPGIPTQDSSGCGRSDHNYASVVSKTLSIESFTDASCGGATTKEFWEPQLANSGTQINSPQLDALSAETKLVTVGMGGNDIGFGSIVSTCVSLALSSPYGNPCQEHYTAGGTDQLATKIAETAPKMAAALDEIHKRAPGAKIYVIGYPTILPAEGNGCFPEVPLAKGDVPYLRDTVIAGLNAMLAEAAKNAAQSEYVDTAKPTIGHDMCASADDRYIEGPLYDGSEAAPVHPNAAGMKAIAELVVAAITPGKPDPTPAPTTTAPGSGGDGHSSGKELSETGATVATTIAAGAVLLGAGVAVTLVSRRRRA